MLNQYYTPVIVHPEEGQKEQKDRSPVSFPPPKKWDTIKVTF